MEKKSYLNFSKQEKAVFSHCLVLITSGVDNKDKNIKEL